MQYALIKNNTIENIIVADSYNANQIKSSLGYDEAINVDGYPVSIGDVYEEGFFLTGKDFLDNEGIVMVSKGTVIERNISQEEQFKNLKEENITLKQKVAEQDQVIEELMFEIIPSLMGGM